MYATVALKATEQLVGDTLSKIGCNVTLPAVATIVVCAAVVYFVTLILKPRFVK